MKLAALNTTAIPVRWRYWATAVLVLCLLLPLWYNTSHSSTGKALNGSVEKLVFDIELAQEETLQQGTQPEDYLRQIESLVEAARYAEAAKFAEILVNDYPTFQLGSLLYAELLNLASDAPKANPLRQIADQDKQTVVAGLDKELRNRLSALRTPYPANSIPKGFGFLAASTEYFAVVDASTSRMYVFKNTATPEQPAQLNLVHDFYVSVGQKGIFKKEEGDGRTPVGVYFTQKKLDEKRLPDLYGAGAITLNYPNLYDRHQGRTGSGIWVHGAPSAQYSRLPEASDGCLVLSNDTMKALLDLDQTKGIPIFIQAKIDWVPANQTFQLPAPLRQLVSEKYLTARSGREAASPSPENMMNDRILHLLSWRDQDRTVVLLDFKTTQEKVMRTYWEESQGTWKQVGESPV
jgi:L,D-peptidoglycan transpeptidase YkuD (ErfK/YbiS/YcfS/YnhG family)